MIHKFATVQEFIEDITLVGLFLKSKDTAISRETILTSTRIRGNNQLKRTMFVLMSLEVVKKEYIEGEPHYTWLHKSQQE